MKTNTFKLIILLISISLISCNSTKILSSWSIPNPSTDAMNKVLVLAVMTDRIAKEQIEQTMVSQLKEDGLNAYTAMSTFGPKGFSGLTDKEITDKLKGSDFTSILIISLLDKEKEKSYTPGTRYSSPNIVGYSRYYRRYLVVYDHIYTPGYFTQQTLVIC